MKPHVVTQFAGNDVYWPDSMIWLVAEFDGETPAGFGEWAELRAFCEHILSLPEPERES